MNLAYAPGARRIPRIGDIRRRYQLSIELRANYFLIVAAPAEID